MSSIKRAFDTMDLLAQRGPLGVRAIARELDLPLGSVHRILNDLAEQEAIERTGDERWELSFRLLQFVGNHLERIKLPTLARPVLEQLAAENRETVFLAVPSRDEIVYLEKVQTDLQMQLNVELGTRRPLHCTALGKAILAFLSESQQQQFLAQGPFAAYTPNTITDPVLLAIELNRIRERGYATDREEIILGVHCIAVPLLNHVGRAVGAISIAGTGPRVGSERFDALVHKMRAAGEQLNLRLGYTPRLDITTGVWHEASSIRSW